MPRWIRWLYARAADAGIAALLSIILPGAVLLNGCGQSGPLTLPNRDAGAAPVSETSPLAEAAPVTETTPESAEDSQVDTGDPDSDDEEQEPDDE